MGWPVARRPILDDPAPIRLPDGSARVSQELDLSQNVTLSLGGMRPDRRLGAVPNMTRSLCLWAPNSQFGGGAR